MYLVPTLVPSASLEEALSGDSSAQEDSGQDASGWETNPDSNGRPSPTYDPEPTTKATTTAKTKGLSVNVSERGNRHSRMLGLPMSPRPGHNQPASPLQSDQSHGSTGI